jgi:tetratricopeptide (TPR) repeat protein
MYYRRAIEADPRHANNLGNYALFLRNVRENYDEAEAYYRRAIDADPRHANNLGSYALFLRNVRKDHDGAEAYYKRAIEADPHDAVNLGNYAEILLAHRTERRSEGLEVVESLLRQQSLPTALEVECCFYAVVYRPDGGRQAALRRLKRLLSAGARSPGWDLTTHVERAREAGRPDADWLEKLAAVISNGADVAVLEGSPEWQEAG